MKKSIAVLTVLFSLSAAAQIDNKEEAKYKKVEVIKIVDGDTVTHTIKEIKAGAFNEDHQKMVHHRMKGGDVSLLDDEMKMMIDEMDVYINVDGMHKKMIIRQMNRGDEDLEEILKSIEKDESLVIDFEDGRSVMKIMKIEISGDDLEEITTIELGPGHFDKKHNRKKMHKMEKSASSTMNVYPNPAKDEINIDFEVLRGNAELSVRDTDGKVIFSKTYKEAGEYKEQIKLKNGNQSVIIINLKEEGRVETRKIIVK